MLTLFVHMLYMQTETATWCWEKHWTKSETPLLLTETSFAQAQRSFSHWSTAFYHVGLVHHFNSVVFVQFHLVSILSLCPYPLNVYVWAVCAISVCFCLTGDLKAMVFSQAFHSKLGHCHGNSVCCLSSAICLWRIGVARGGPRGPSPPRAGAKKYFNRKLCTHDMFVNWYNSV